MWDIDKQLRENEEAAKNSKIILHPSSIKERIDNLTEAEAKAALVYLVNLVGATAICKTCPLHQECFHDIEATSCKERFLNWAIVDFELEGRK